MGIQGGREALPAIPSPSALCSRRTSGDVPSLWPQPGKTQTLPHSWGGYIEREDSRRSGGATGSPALSCHLALPFQGCPGRSRQGQWQQHSRVGSTGSAPGWEGVLTPPFPEAIAVLGEPGWLAFLNVEAQFSPGHTCKYTSPSLCVCDPGTPHSSEAMETACA